MWFSVYCFGVYFNAVINLIWTYIISVVFSLVEGRGGINVSRININTAAC